LYRSAKEQRKRQAYLKTAKQEGLTAKQDRPDI
jgi:hypothetical protein